MSMGIHGYGGYVWAWGAHGCIIGLGGWGDLETNHMDGCNVLGQHVSKLVLDIYNLHKINQQC